MLPLSSLPIFWPEKVFLLIQKAFHASRRLYFGQGALQQIMRCKQMSKMTWKETQLVALYPHHTLFTLALDWPHEHWQADTSKAFLLRTCLTRSAEHGKISLIRVQGPPNVPPALLQWTQCFILLFTSPFLHQTQHQLLYVAHWACLAPACHWGTVGSRVMLQRCNFSNPGLKITIQRCWFCHSVFKGCIISCLSVTQNKLFS